MLKYFTNQERQIGDVVQIARWDEPVLKEAATFYNIKHHLIDDVKFVVKGISTAGGKLHLEIEPMHGKHGDKAFKVTIDDSNLIKVG